MGLMRWFGRGRAAGDPRRTSRRALSFSVDIPPEITGGLTSGSVAPRISRAEALQVPAVLRARNLICGTLATLPLKRHDRNRMTVPWRLGDQPDPEIPTSVMWAMTFEDLLFEGVSWWRVTRFGFDGFPVEARHVPIGSVFVSGTPSPPSRAQISPDEPFPVDGQVFIDGMPVPDREIIRFDSPNPPLLRHAARAIRACLALDMAAATFSTSPVPLGYFAPREGVDPASDEEIEAILDQWEDARRRRAWGYVSAALEAKTLQWNPEQLQLADQRQHAVLEIARAAGLDPEDLGVSTTSRTYQNSEQRRQDLLDFTLGAYVSAVQDRLSMRDVLPRGHVARFKFDGFLRSDTKTRMETYAIGVTVGAYTTEEVRELEDRPPLPGATPAAQPSPAEQRRPRVAAAASKEEQEEPRMATVHDLPARPVDQAAFAHPQAVAFSQDCASARVTFDSPEVAASFRVNPEKRTISGLAVPWGATARSGFATWKFAPGSLHWRDDARVKMNLDHDRSQTVGRGVRLQNTPQGLDVTFKVARGPEGDRALALAEDGVYDGFSVEVDFDGPGDAWVDDPEDGGVRLVQSGTLRGVALTAMPAFDDARVTSVVAADQGNITTPDAGDLNAAARRYAAQRGWAMPDGSYPIRPLDMHGRADLEKAIRAVGRGGGSHDAIRRHIIRRARALGLSELIPDTWNDDGSMAAAAGNAEIGDATMGTDEKTVEAAAPAAVVGNQPVVMTDEQFAKFAAPQQALAAAVSELTETIRASRGADGEGPQPVRAARQVQVTSEPPVYTFTGHGPSLVRDTWHARNEHNPDAIDRLNRFRRQQEEMVHLFAQRPDLAFDVNTGNASAVIPPGYRPDLYVTQLLQGRPLSDAASRGTLSDATPFVLPRFVSSSGAAGTHTEGTNPTSGSLSIDSVTVTPAAVSGSFLLTREIVDSSNPAIDAIALTAMREAYSQNTEARTYAELNGTNGQGGTITGGFVPSGAQVSAVGDPAGTPPGAPPEELIAGVRAALALYPFRRFAAPNRMLISQEATSAFASATGTDGRPLLPSVGAQNTAGIGNAVNQGWFVDGLAAQPAWSITGNGDTDADVFMFNSTDLWVWESPLLTFRFEEKQGPALIELALFGYFATRLIRPVGLAAIRYTKAA